MNVEKIEIASSISDIYFKKICKTLMTTYRSQLRQLEVIVVDLENVTSGRAENCDGESHSLLNDAYLIWLASYFTELRSDLQNAKLWHCN